MKKRPKAFIYMTVGGVVSGAILGGLYTALVMIYWGFTSSSTSLVNAIGFAVLGAILVGIGSAQFFGAFGLVSGFIMEWRVNRMTFPASQADMTQLRKQVYRAIYLLAGLASIASIIFIITTFDFQDPLLIEGILIYVMFPIIIVTFAAVFIMTMYIKQLATYQPPTDDI